MINKKRTVKYLFKVFDENSEMKSQVIVPAEEMLNTLKALNELGVVKGYIIFDQEESEEK